MAIATHLTLATGHNLLLGEGDEMQTNGEMQRVSVSVTYELEQGDLDVPLLATVRASEVAQAHRAAAEVLRAHAFAPLPQPAHLHPQSANPDRSRAELAGSEEVRLEEARAEAEDPLRPEEPTEDDPDADHFSEDDPEAPDFNDEEANDEAASDDDSEEYPDGNSVDQNASPFQEQSYQEPAVQKPSLGQAISGAIGSSSTPNGSQSFGSRAYPNGAQEVPSGPRITQPQKIAIQSLARQIGLAPYELTSILQQQFGTWSLERLGKDQAHDLHVALQQGLKDKKEKDRLEKQTGNGQPKATETMLPDGNRAPSRNGHTAIAST